MSNTFIEDYAQRRAQYDREAVAQLKTEKLIAQWDVLQSKKSAAKQARSEEEEEYKRYVDMLAEALNVKVGMRVSRTKKHGYGANAKLRTTLYEVTGWRLYIGPTSLSLMGRTIRKDGTPGEVFEIGGSWERVR